MIEIQKEWIPVFIEDGNHFRIGIKLCSGVDVLAIASMSVRKDVLRGSFALHKDFTVFNRGLFEGLRDRVSDTLMPFSKARDDDEFWYECLEWWVDVQIFKAEAKQREREGPLSPDPVLRPQGGVTREPPKRVGPEPRRRFRKS